VLLVHHYTKEVLNNAVPITVRKRVMRFVSLMSRRLTSVYVHKKYMTLLLNTSLQLCALFVRLSFIYKRILDNNQFDLFDFRAVLCLIVSGQGEMPSATDFVVVDLIALVLML